MGLAPVEEEEEGEDAGRKQRELERMMQETQVRKGATCATAINGVLYGSWC